MDFDKNFSDMVQLLEEFIEPMLNETEITTNKKWQPQSWKWR